MREFFRFWGKALGHSLNAWWGTMGIMSTASLLIAAFGPTEWTTQTVARYMLILPGLVFVAYFFWAPYRRYSEIQQEKSEGESKAAEALAGMERRVKESEKAASIEVEAIRKREADLQEAKLREAETKINSVAAKYYNAWVESGKRPGPWVSMQLLIASGVGDLEGIPHSVDQLITAIKLKGAPDPLYNHWDKEYLFRSVQWCLSHKGLDVTNHQDFGGYYQMDYMQGKFHLLPVIITSQPASSARV